MSRRQFLQSVTDQLCVNTVKGLPEIKCANVAPFFKLFVNQASDDFSRDAAGTPSHPPGKELLSPSLNCITSNLSGTPSPDPDRRNCDRGLVILASFLTWTIRELLRAVGMIPTTSHSHIRLQASERPEQGGG